LPDNGLALGSREESQLWAQGIIRTCCWQTAAEIRRVYLRFAQRESLSFDRAMSWR